MINALRQRDFALLWLGGLISDTGDWVLTIGLPIYVFLLTHSVLATGLAFLAARVPAIVLGSVAGVFVDRWDRKRTMIIANVLLAASLLPLLLVISADLVWIVYAVSTIESVLEQFVSPAQNALIPALVSEERLVAANSLNSLSSNMARLCGPALGGVVAAVWGLWGIVLGDAVSFALAALLIAGISTRHARRADAVAPQVGAGNHRTSLGRLLREWADGMRTILGERVLVVLVVAFAISNLGEGVFGTLYPILVNRVLHGVALQIGELMSAQAVGGLLGGIAAGWIGERLLSRWLIGMSAVVFGAIDLAIFNAPVLLPGALAVLAPQLHVPIFTFEIGLFVAVGIPGIWVLTGGLSLLQMSAPDAYRGRVFGVLGAVYALLNVAGIIAASTLTDRLGVVTMLNIQGCGYIVAGMLILTLLPRRRSKPAMPESTSSSTAALISDPVVC